MALFDQVPGGISDALRGHLAALGATAPSYVMDKSLEKSDVQKGQARLLFSCKGGDSLARCPLTGVFTEQETKFVWSHGLLVTAFDRGGRSYHTTCKYLTSNFGYRFITGWNPLVQANGLRPGMRVELWAFRSHQLPNQYNVKEKVRTEIGHPDGSLGLVVLHYESSDPEHGDDDEHDEALPVPETETMGQMIKSEVAMPEENEKLALAGGGGAACAGPTMTKEEMVARFGIKPFLAALGLITLKRACSEAQKGKGKENEEGEKHKVQCLWKNIKIEIEEVT